VSDFIEGIGGETAAHGCFGIRKATGAGESQAPPTDELSPAASVNFRLRPLPLLELGRIAQIETVKEGPPVERYRFSQGRRALRAHLVRRVIMSDPA
jgi:hypothetical protein